MDMNEMPGRVGNDIAVSTDAQIRETILSNRSGAKIIHQSSEPPCSSCGCEDGRIQMMVRVSISFMPRKNRTALPGLWHRQGIYPGIWAGKFTRSYQLAGTLRGIEKEPLPGSPNVLGVYNPRSGHLHPTSRVHRYRCAGGIAKPVSRPNDHRCGDRCARTDCAINYVQWVDDTDRYF